jgi:hypothetical protein
MPVKTGIQVWRIGWREGDPPVFTAVTKADKIFECEMKINAAVFQPQCW